VRITAVIVIALGVGFFFVHRAKNAAEARLADATSNETMEAPAVNVFTVTPSPGTQSLKLPGETAAWNETAIYARVNGYGSPNGLPISVTTSSPARRWR